MSAVRILLAVLAALAGPVCSAGERAAAPRAVTIDMLDAMRFAPGRLTLAPGRQIEFRVRNAGKLRHEIVIGTAAQIDQHRRAMLRAAHAASDPGTDHADHATHAPHAAPNMAQLAPGRRARLRWKFDRPGEYEYACLLPGHYEAGMKGSITVR